MKKFILFVVLMSMISMAGAVQNFGPPSGIKVAAIDVTNDARIRGDLTLDGTLGVGTNVSNGVFAEDIALGAGYDWYSITGAGVVDFGNMTGYFYGPTGVTLLNGNTKVTGTKTFMVNNGAAIFGSSVTAASITSNATVAGADLTASDDAIITDDLVVDGAARIDETATINAGIINSTLDVNGATTTAAITVDSGSIVTADQYKRRTSTTATNTTITDGGPDVYLVGNGTGVNTQTITFPTAADNKGRIITVILATDPLTNSVILDGESSEQIDGANTKTTTDAVGSMYHLICNGVGWIKLASSGTWS